MFNKAIVYYPANEKALFQIFKDIAAFRCTAAINYIETLKLSDRQIETLYTGLAEDIAAKK